MFRPDPDNGPDRPNLVPAGGDGGGQLAGAGHPVVPQTLAPTPTPSALFVAFRRRAVLALTLGLLGAACTGAAAWRLVPEPKYKVRALIHIASVPEKILGSASGGSETQFNYFQKTQITLVKSQVVLDKVARDPEVVQLTRSRGPGVGRDWLAGALDADFKQGPEILTITIKGDEPYDLVVFVNAVARAYLDEFVNTEQRRLRVRTDKLKELQWRHHNLLQEKRAQLQRMKADLGGVGDGVLKQMLSAHEELQSVQADLAKAEVAVKQREAKLAAAKTYKVPDAVIDRELAQDAALARYTEEITKLEDKVTAMRDKARSREVADRELRRMGVFTELERARKNREARRAEMRGEVVARLKAARLVDLEEELEKSREALAYLRLREQQLQTGIKDRERAAKAQGEGAFKLALLEREVEEEDKIVTAVTNEIRSLQLDRDAPPRAKPLEEAVVSSNLGKKRFLVTCGGAAGAFLLAVGAVSLWEFSKRKLEFVDEVVHGFGIGIVGTMPTIKGRAAQGKAGTVENWSGYIDSFRTILMRGKARADMQVLMVTSAEEGEGKTSLSAHLAVSLARSGRKTLLLDGDMRNPSAHRLFALPRSPGLSEVLTGKQSLRRALRPTTVGGLWLLPAGARSPEAIEQLAAPILERLFGCLRQGFDVVVVDSCPLLPVADSLHLAEHADGVIFSVRRRVSRLPKLSAALHRIRMIGAPVLGAVVHGTDEDVYSHSYYTPVQPAQA